MLKEFTEFIRKGDLVSLAVAFIMGMAFAAVVTALVTNVFTPLIALIIGQPSFGGLSFTISDTTFTYGRFLNALISFLSTAAVVFFFVVRPYNAFMDRFRQADEDSPEANTVLLEEIRDLLKQQNAR